MNTIKIPKLKKGVSLLIDSSTIILSKSGWYSVTLKKQLIPGTEIEVPKGTVYSTKIIEENRNFISLTRDEANAFIRMLYLNQLRNGKVIHK